MIILLAGLSGSGKNTLADALELEFEKYGQKTVQMAFSDPIKELTQMIFGWDAYYLWGASQMRSVFPIHWERYPKVLWENAFSNCMDVDVCRFALDLGLTYQDLRSGVETLFNRCVKVQELPMPPYADYKWIEDLTAREILKCYGDLGRAIDPNMWVLELVKRAGKVQNAITIVTDARYPNEIQAIKELGGQVWLVVDGTPGAGTAQAPDTHSSESSLPKDPSVYDMKVYNDRSKGIEYLNKAANDLVYGGFLKGHWAI